MIKNKKNGKIYIGQTTRPIHKRLEEHQIKTGCVAIHGAIKKHGWKNFEKEWYEVPNDDLNFYEEMLIALLGTLSPSGYNLREGGGSTGKLSEETKQKIGEANKGKTHTEGTKQKNREAKLGKKNPNFGIPKSKETKQKMREAKIGKPKSKEHIQNMRKPKSKEHIQNMRKPRSKEHIQNMSESKKGDKNILSKRVYQYDLDGNFINSFASAGEAGRHFEKSGSCISKCARGELKTAHKFKWSYVKT